jgi:hypothetical protein
MQKLEAIQEQLWTAQQEAPALKGQLSVKQDEVREMAAELAIMR